MLNLLSDNTGTQRRDWARATGLKRAVLKKSNRRTCLGGSALPQIRSCTANDSRVWKMRQSMSKSIWQSTCTCLLRVFVTHFKLGCKYDQYMETVNLSQCCMCTLQDQTIMTISHCAEPTTSTPLLFYHNYTVTNHSLLRHHPVPPPGPGLC